MESEEKKNFTPILTGFSFFLFWAVTAKQSQINNFMFYLYLLVEIFSSMIYGRVMVSKKVEEY